MLAAKFCKAHGACDEGKKWAGKRTMAQVWDDCPRSEWMFWCLEKAEIILPWDTSVKIAIEGAEHVIHLYTGDSDAPKKAIEAAKKCLRNNTTKNRAAAGAAGAAAVAAAGADARAAAVAAAGAAVAAAWAAAGAARAAAWAAANAVVAATFDGAAERQWQADMIRRVVGKNPFKED